MSVTIKMPTPLRPYVNNQDELTVAEGGNVIELMNRLSHEHPGLTAYLFDDNKNLRKFINIYINDTDIRDLNGPETAINDKDVISLIPAIAGGLS